MHGIGVSVVTENCGICVAAFVAAVCSDSTTSVVDANDKAVGSKGGGDGEWAWRTGRLRSLD